MSPVPQAQQPEQNADALAMASLALNSIQDGVMITDGQGIVKMINPAAARIIGVSDGSLAVGLDISLCVKLETNSGEQIQEAQNPFLHAVKTNQNFKSRDFVLNSNEGGKKVVVELDVIPTDGPTSDRIITWRDIGKEKEEEKAQSEFISTASHEMRTPVASIEGYLGLALNPQTATIDQRARGYLEAAHNASQHLGRLFQDLLDVTKLDDHKIRPRSVPVELTDCIKKIADEYASKFKEKNINYFFGARGSNQAMRTVQQPVYTFADVDFLNEIVSNLVENAFKYTPEGESVWVSVQGDDKRAIITVADSGIGISSEDLKHIFQKFYRVDNSQTREIGGTGLGLYLVKQRTEAMDGKVWAESVYGKGSTFFVSLPRLSRDEYDKRRIALANEIQVQKAQQEKQLQEVMAFAQRQQAAQAPAQPAPQHQPQPVQPLQPAQPAPQPAPAAPQQSAQPAQPAPQAQQPQQPQSPQPQAVQSTQNNQNIIQ